MHQGTEEFSLTSYPVQIPHRRCTRTHVPQRCRPIHHLAARLNIQVGQRILDRLRWAQLHTTSHIRQSGKTTHAHFRIVVHP